MIWLVDIVLALIGVWVKKNLYSLRAFLKSILYQWIKQSPIQIKNRKSGSDPQKGWTIKFKEITKFEYITIPVSDYESFLLIMNL